MSYTLSINGQQHVADVDGDTPLLWVLRDVLGMNGTKYGCGMALCGASTVHMDGAAIHDATGKRVRRLPMVPEDLKTV